MSMALLVIVPTLTGSIETAPALATTVQPIQIEENLDLTEYSGFLPVSVHGEASGTFAYPGSHNEETSRIADDHNLSDSIVISLNYGGDHLECAATFYLAAAVTLYYNGVAIETQSAQVMDSTALADAGEQCYALAQQE